MKCVLTFALIFGLTSAHGLSIREAVQQGNQQLIQELPKIPHSLAPNILKSYQRVKLYANVDAELIVTQHNKGGATIPGIIALDYSLELMAELPRQFVIAHEFAHLRRNHPAKRVDLMAKLVPQDLATAEGQARLRIIQFIPEMKEQSFAFELEADLEAAHILQEIGWKKPQILLAMKSFEQTSDTLTHPSITKRYLNLKSRLAD